MKIARLAFVFLLLTANCCVASGIDCSRASRTAEKLICEDPSIKELDRELSDLFASVLRNAIPNDRAQVVADQKKWISDVRDHCADSTCLHDAYVERLRGIAAVDDETSFIYEPKEIQETLASIRASFQRYGISGQLGQCETLIRIGSGPEHSFGARCAVNNHALHLCNDTMVGKLTVSFEPPGSSARVLSQFTKDNCPPGG